MGILTRMVRLFKADIHGVMDQLEDQDLLLKQHLREMEQALSQKEAQLSKMIAYRSRVQQEYETYKKETEKLGQDVAVAIKGDKDDIARMLIKRNRSAANYRDELESSIKRQDQQITQLRDCLKQQRLMYEHIKHRSDEYFHKAEQKQWEESMSFISVSEIYQEPHSEEIELELFQRKEAIKGGEAA